MTMLSNSCRINRSSRTSKQKRTESPLSSKDRLRNWSKRIGRKWLRSKQTKTQLLPPSMQPSKLNKRSSWLWERNTQRLWIRLKAMPPRKSQTSSLKTRMTFKRSMT
jgi:hypothetical protein